MSRRLFTSDSARRALGVAGVVGLLAFALCSDANVLTRFHIMNTAKAEDSLIGAFHPRKLAAHATLQHGFNSSRGDIFHLLLFEHGSCQKDTLPTLFNACSQK